MKRPRMAKRGGAGAEGRDRRLRTRRAMPHRGMRGSHPLGRWRVFVIVPIALLCLAFPFALVSLEGNSGLIDDTRAFFGAGTAQGVPAVTDVSCLNRRYGSNSSRGIGASDWSCTLYLALPKQPPEKDPWAGLSYEEAMRENDRRIAALGESLRSAERWPSRIERVTASDRTGDLPALRRVSAPGEPPRFGVVWSGWELASRWLFRALISGLFIAIGLFCLIAARRIWRQGG